MRRVDLTLRTRRVRVDTSIHARWVVPVEPAGTLHHHWSVVIDHGRIVDLLPTAEARAAYEAETDIERSGHLLIPGFVNAHTHAPMTLLRGLADDLDLATWLEKHIWPAEMRWVSPEFVRDGTELAVGILESPVSHPPLPRNRYTWRVP